MASANLQDQKQPAEASYDVFATPFVPAALRIINRHEPSHIIETPPIHVVDFANYTASFAARGFLPPRSTDVELPLEGSVSAGDTTLSPASYCNYFREAWKTERAATTFPELFKVKLELRFRSDNGSYMYSFRLPGVRENDPLVERGDVIYLRRPSIEVIWHPGQPVSRLWDGVQYNASVYSVQRREEIVVLIVSGLDFFGYSEGNSALNIIIPPKYRLEQAQRNSLCLIHNELQLEKAQGTRSKNDWIRRMLFPVEADGVLQTALRKVPHQRGLFDGQCNYEQLQAVDAACKCYFGVLPFLISGVPGAGKTKTLVEVALQLLLTTKVGHILICAPSDQAADTLAIRLQRILKPDQLLRLNGPQRADNEVPGELLSYCYRERDMFYIPPFKQFMAYEVVVTSTRDASLLAESRLTNSDLYRIEKDFQSALHPGQDMPPSSLHWGALIVDEAAQATEIEILPALNVVMPPSEFPSDLEQPRLIMAGDVNQLGPKSASKDIRYSRSLFSRLLGRPLYANHPLSRFNARPNGAPIVPTSKMIPMICPPFVNLRRNYRSHPAILSVPSALFYNDTLVPEATIETNTPLHNSKLWQGRRWPVLYIPVDGEDELEREGGGWYNISEAKQACILAQQLILEASVPQRDIAVITPFAAQVNQLRNIFRRANLWDVNIGPVEAFQGLESKVVVLCTTRTRERFLEEDTRRHLGIINSRRKMNVALTRAKDALFVLGNAQLLMRDKHWEAFLAYCWRNGLIHGDPFTEKMVEKFKSHGTHVLERALCWKEDHTASRAKSLGSKVPAFVWNGIEDDQMWATAAVEDLHIYDDNDDDQGIGHSIQSGGYESNS